MKYVKVKPRKPTFSQKGLDGFMFPLENKNVEVYFVDSQKGHDNFVVAKTISHIYYVLKGNGTFYLNDKEYKAKKEMVVEIPPKTEFAYTGKMKLLLIMNPPHNSKDLKTIKANL